MKRLRLTAILSVPADEVVTLKQLITDVLTAQVAVLFDNDTELLRRYLANLGNLSWVCSGGSLRASSGTIQMLSQFYKPAGGTYPDTAILAHGITVPTSERFIIEGELDADSLVLYSLAGAPLQIDLQFGRN